MTRFDTKRHPQMRRVSPNCYDHPVLAVGLSREYLSHLFDSELMHRRYESPWQALQDDDGVTTQSSYISSARKNHVI